MSIVEVDKCTIDRAGITKVNIREFGSYTWTIVNFEFGRRCLKNVDYYSPVFRTGLRDEYEWHFCLTDGDRDLHLELMHTKLEPELKASSDDQEGYLHFVLLNKWGKEDVTTASYVHIMLDQTGEEQCSDIFMNNKEYIIDEKNGLLHNGNLTLLCKMYYKDATMSTYPCESRRHVPVSIPVRKKDDDFEKLFNSERFADLDVVCKDKVFRAHKAILVARCPVFAAMFEDDAIDNTKNRVDMKEIEPDIGRELLRFIYSGKVNNLEKRARELLAGADMYGLLELKAMSEQVLVEDITDDNVGEMLLLADMYKADYLKQKAIDHIILHAKDIVNTEVFKKVMMKSSPVLIELVAKLIDLKVT